MAGDCEEVVWGGVGGGGYRFDEAIGDGDVVWGGENISSVEDADVGDDEFGVVRGWGWFDVGCRGVGDSFVEIGHCFDVVIGS